MNKHKFTIDRLSLLVFKRFHKYTGFFRCPKRGCYWEGRNTQKQQLEEGTIHRCPKCHKHLALITEKNRGWNKSESSRNLRGY